MTPGEVSLSMFCVLFGICIYFESEDDGGFILGLGFD